MIKKLYEIEIRRFYKFEKIIIITVAFMASIFFTVLTFPSEAQQEWLLRNIKSILNYLFVILGVILPVFSQSFFGGDYKQGIFATYLSYPLSPVKIAVGKLSAQFTYYSLALFISLLLFIFLVPHPPEELLLIIAGVFLLLFLLYIITFFSLILIKYQPLPQFFTIIFFFLIFYGSDSMSPQWYVVNPISFLCDFLGYGIHSSQALMYGLLAVPFYAALFFIPYVMLNRMEWGRGGGI